MAYVDGYVAAVPVASREAYVRLAREVAAIYRKHGALEVVESWGDDVPEGKLTSFPMAVKLGPGEAVVFSWIRYPSREARDVANAKVMADPLMQADRGPAPFDAKRMIFGGFEVLVGR